MRVIHISPTAFGPDGLFGGGERYALELARALTRHIECRLITFGARADRYRYGELDVTVLKRSLLLRGHPAHPVARGLTSALRSAELVHTHHLRAFPSRIAGILALLLRRTRVVTDHGLGRGRWPAIDARLFDRFLTVSRYSAEVLRSPPEKTRLIYGGADIDRLRPEPGDKRAGILFVGRLTPHKGVDRLIAALPDDASLTIAGTPGHDPRTPERDYPELLRRLAEGRDVRFLGRVGDEELAMLYRRARVLVMPSVHRTYYDKYVAIPELLGLALLEAMASGTPVIASRVGGLPEAVVDGVTGFVVEPGDVEHLRRRLDELLRDDRLFAELSANARDHVVANFTWEKCAERCVSAYREVTERHSLQTP